MSHWISWLPKECFWLRQQLPWLNLYLSLLPSPEHEAMLGKGKRLCRHRMFIQTPSPDILSFHIKLLQENNLNKSGCRKVRLDIQNGTFRLNILLLVLWYLSEEIIFGFWIGSPGVKVLLTFLFLCHIFFNTYKLLHGKQCVILLKSILADNKSWKNKEEELVIFIAF